MDIVEVFAQSSAFVLMLFQDIKFLHASQTPGPNP